MNKLPELLAVACLWAGAASAQPTPCITKPAWKWTEEERLAARFDAKKQAERNAADVALDYTGPDDERSKTIVGYTHPELFLPWELFDHLVHVGFHENLEFREAMRSIIEERAAALGFGSDLWDQLEPLSARFVSFRRQDLEDARRGLPSLSEGLSVEEALRAEADRSCGARVEALNAALKLWGEEATLRLLYEVVAPGYFVTSINGPDSPERLSLIGRGCK